jgi:glycosyltransferase involved in cell wall biosynthesis
MGMKLVNLPALRRKSLETISHTALSVGHVLAGHRPDVAFVFNAANAPLSVPLRIARVPLAIHIDGLEWQRAKWGTVGRGYYRHAESLSVRIADAIIADARGIQSYVEQRYGVSSVFIPYGAPTITPGTDRLSELGLAALSYHLVVARLEPENHVQMIVAGYRDSNARLPLVVVGDAPYANAYRQSVSELAAPDDRIRLLGSIWDQQLLDQLYSGASSYIHGHSVGGTNPSLLRALGAGAPVTAFDVSFNREVTAGHARFFHNRSDVRTAVEADEREPAQTKQRGDHGRIHAEKTYRWDDVAGTYERLAQALSRTAAVRSSPGGAPS